MLALGNCFQKLIHLRRLEIKLFIIPLKYVITNLVKASRCKSQTCQSQAGTCLNTLIFLKKLLIPKKWGECARPGSHGLTSWVFKSHTVTPVHSYSWAQQVELGWLLWVQHTDLALGPWFDLKMSRDGDTNIPHSRIFQRLVFSLLKTCDLFPIWLCLALVSGHWFSLFLGQINLFIIIHTDIQPWRSYPVFSAAPRDLNRWQRQTSSCVKKGKAQLGKILHLRKFCCCFFFKKTTAPTNTCSILRLQSFVELLITSSLLESCLHRIHPHSS